MRIFKNKIRVIDRWLFCDGPPEVTDATRFLLVDAAEAFLRAGGAMTVALWLRIPDVCRSAFVVAGDRIKQPSFPVSIPGVYIPTEQDGDERIKRALDDICKKAEAQVKSRGLA